MKANVKSRRSFIRTTGVALSVPLAAVGAALPASVAADGDSIEARLGRLEDLEAIRALNQAFAREVKLIAADFGQRDVIEVAPDRTTATGSIHGTVEIETVIGPSCPLVEMAREQGGGVVKRSETGVFSMAYARRDGVWTIQGSKYRPEF